MYNDYFGLREPPFSIAPNPQYLFMSPRHREALAHLLYGIQSDGGFILLTGEVGTGKTTVCRCLLEQIPEDVDTAYILNPKQTAQELLATACDEFKIDYPEGASIKVLVDALNKFLLESHQKGRKTVLIIDEAQNLSVDVLEQLRLLTNLETNQRKLLQIILLGQPELLTLLARQELRQLSQRVTARFHLDALNREEVADYIQHRLDTAGAKGSLFPPGTVKRIYQISNGIPRLINLVCDRALLGTYVQNKLQVDVATVNNAAKEILGPAQKKSYGWMYAIAALLLIVVVGSLVIPQTVSQPAITSHPEANTTAPGPEPTTVSEAVTPIVEPMTTTDAAIDTTVDLVEDGYLITPDTARQQLASIPKPEANTVSEPDPAPTSVSVLQPQAEFTEVATTDLTDVPGYATQAEAFENLFAVWGVDIELDQDADPCALAPDSGLQCLSKLGSLRDIAHMNRPVILNLTTANKSQWFVVTSIKHDYVEVTTDNSTYRLSESQVLEVWSGFYSLLWRTPPSYANPARRGDRGAPVDWLQTQLALSEGGTVSLVAGAVFDEALERRVKRFQISVGLVPDGIVGPQTWIHLNSVGKSDIPRLDQI